MIPCDAKGIVNSLLSFYATYQQVLDADNVPCLVLHGNHILSVTVGSSSHLHLPDIEVSHSSVLGLLTITFFVFLAFCIFSSLLQNIWEKQPEGTGLICSSFADFSPAWQVRYGGKSLQASCFLADQNTKGNTGTRGRSKCQRPPLVCYLHHKGPTSQKLQDLPTEHNYLGTKH